MSLVCKRCAPPSGGTGPDLTWGKFLGVIGPCYFAIRVISLGAGEEYDVIPRGQPGWGMGQGKFE